MNYHPLAKCDECPLQEQHSYVPSTLPDSAHLAAVGEAPGGVEVRQGRPFVGPSGRLLGVVLAEHRIDASKVVFTNVVSCRPPENRTPSKLEISCCEPRLRSELESVSQILTVGNTASNAIIGGKHAITNLRIGPPRVSERYPGKEVVPTFHPAACLRSSDNFPSFVKDVAKLVQPKLVWEPPQYRVVERYEDAERIASELSVSRTNFIFDIETAYDKDTGFEHASNIPLLCIGVGTAPGRVTIFAKDALRNENAIRRVLQSGGLTAHNGKFDLQGTRRFAPDAKLEFDTMLASYAADERGGVHGLKYLATEILGAPDYSAGMKRYKTYADCPPDELYRYNALDCRATYDLRTHYQTVLDADGRRLNEFLTRVSNAITPMEYQGIRVDEDYLDKVDSEFNIELLLIETQLSPWVENPRSPQQVVRAFSKMGIETETSDKEFLASVIESPSLAFTEVHDFAVKLLLYRQQHKLFSTYIRGSRNRLYNGRLYPTILLHGTTSGRPSCRNPNLYNIPRGSVIRKLFIPDDGNVFVDVDIRQNESRVVCTLARDENLRAILSDPNRDLHEEIAAQLGLPRQEAKVIVHAVAYEAFGKEEYLLAHHANKPISWARRYIRDYWKLFPAVAKWKKDLGTRVLTDQEDLVTPYGRHRRFWLITDTNREDIIRNATSFLPQSIGSDICITALTRLLELGVRCRLSVYDDIIAECPPDLVPEVAKLIQEAILEAGKEFTDYVPFHTDVKVGTNWGELSSDLATTGL